MIQPDDGGADSRKDAAAPSCVSSRICTGNVVRQCSGGVAGALIETCSDDQTCSSGRCTSHTCADAERNETVTGCLFYGADLDNVNSDDLETTTVLLANPGNGMAMVDLEMREPSKPWTLSQWKTIPPGSAGSFVIPDHHLEGGGLGAALAFRIVSDAPISATLIASDDRNETARSTAGTVLVPAHALGTGYLVMTYPQAGTPQILATPGGRRGAGQVAIVATDKDTTVTFQTSLTANAGPEGGAPSTPPGHAFNLLLDDGDIYQLFSIADGDDLTGSVITSNKPIAVFSGNITTTYGRDNEGVHSPDMAMEQMIPVTGWSRNYVAGRLGPQEATCDSIFSGSSALWRILAAEDGTLVTFTTPPGVGGLPTSGLTLNAGGIAELLVSSAGSFVISGNKPIMVTQAMDCEGTLSPGVPTDVLMSEYLFSLPAIFDHEVVIVRKADAQILLDGMPINDSLFLPAGGRYEVARVHIAPCVGEPDRCLHRLNGQFGVTIRGMDVVCAYAVTPQPWLRCDNPDTPGCIR